MGNKIESISVCLLSGRMIGGGTEAHANWLCHALRTAGIAAELYSLFPNHSNSSWKEECFEALTSRFAYTRLTDYIRSKHPSHIICFGRVTNCFGHRLKKQFPEVRLIATCRTNRRLPKAYKKTLVEADLVLVNSKWAAERVEKMEGMNDTAVTLIPNALLHPELLALEQNKKVSLEARRDLGLKATVPVLCMLAQFVSGKNQKDLIQMLADGALPPETQLLLVGEGPQLKDCRIQAKRLGIGGAVFFPGRLNKLESIFQASDLVVSTSLRDSNPNALIEAQAAGIPIVAYDVAGVGESLIDRKTGFLVAPGDSHSFSEALVQLITNGEQRAKFSKKAREQVAIRFEPRKILNHYLTELSL